jgi:hypothetical protein
MGCHGGGGASGKSYGSQGGIGGLREGEGVEVAAETAGDCAAKDLWIGGRKADTNPIPTYLNLWLSTPQNGQSAAVFYPLGHPTPYASGDRQYRR